MNTSVDNLENCDEVGRTRERTTCMIPTKSPKKMAAVALAVGKEAFRDYADKFSPTKFTPTPTVRMSGSRSAEPVEIKEFEKKDDRGVWQSLLESVTIRRMVLSAGFDSA